MCHAIRRSTDLVDKILGAKPADIPRGQMHFNQLERRELIALLGGRAVAWPFARAAVV
jgi:hypothetical protein